MSQTKFFALTTDVQCEFTLADGKKDLSITVGEDSEHPMQLHGE
jgi:hypothetical protein